MTRPFRLKIAKRKAAKDYLTNVIGVPVTNEMLDQIREAAASEERTIAQWGRSAFKRHLEASSGK